MRSLFLLGTLICSLILSPCLHAQKKSKKAKGSSYSKKVKKIEMDLLRKALKNIQYANFEEDIRDYEELLKIDSTNLKYNFGMAMALYTNFQAPKAIPYFERALRNSKDTIGDAYYFLANSYHLAGNYTAAEKHYNIYHSLLLRKGSFLPQNEAIFLRGDIKRRIEMCANGRELNVPSVSRDSLFNNGRLIIITDAGLGVNSKFDDYGAAFKGDDSVMYFTTRREGTTGYLLDYDDKYFEDICVSYFEENKWSDCEKVPSPVNSRKHEAIINVSRDGNRLYFYKSIDQGTFYYSDLQRNGSWSKLKPLKDITQLNSNAWETTFYGFATTVADNELFVVSDRVGGVGGRDIYVSKKTKDGKWGPVSNLSKTINTPYDEDGPYLTPDGNTMYFSSTGHNSMGGFDIFRSTRKDTGWSQAENLGPPLNTPGDDVFITFLHNSNRASYSSSGFAKDSTRDMDIYMIDLCSSQNVNAIKGLAKGVASGTITVTDKSTKDEVGKFAVKNGKYIIIVPLGREYSFAFQNDSIEPAAVDLFVPRQCLVYDIYQELVFTKPGDSLYFRNAFFDIAKATVNAGDTSYGAFLSHANLSKYENFTIAAAATRPRMSVTDSLQNNIVVTVSDTVRHTTTSTITFNNVLFDFDKSIIKDEYKPELNKVSSHLVTAKPRDKIEVAGHADSKGSDAYNMALSKRRANVVSVYLNKQGVAKPRMKVVGYGESAPVAPNTNQDGSDNPEGRAKNRRTEIIIVSTDLGAVIDDYFEGKKVYATQEIKELIGPDESSAQAVKESSAPSKPLADGTPAKHR